MADIVVTAAQVGAIYESAEIVDMIAVEAITKGQAVYMDANGKAGVADANVAGKQQLRGIALEAGAVGQIIPVLKRGHCYGFTVSGLDCNVLVYLSNTAGALADAAGAMTVNAGRVVAMPDNALTKVLYIEADWLRTWT